MALHVSFYNIELKKFISYPRNVSKYTKKINFQRKLLTSCDFFVACCTYCAISKEKLIINRIPNKRLEEIILYLYIHKIFFFRQNSFIKIDDQCSHCIS